jgi:hypothetical protein
MNKILKERRLERAARSLRDTADLSTNLRMNYVVMLQSMQRYVLQLSEHAQANAALMLEYLERVSQAHSVSEFSDAACVLSEGQFELTSRQTSDFVMLAQKTTIIALHAGSAIPPTPPRPVPDPPDEMPLPDARGPRTPYPVNDPGVI